MMVRPIKKGMTMIHLYAVTISAQNSDSTTSAPLAVLASSKDEACAYAVTIARTEYWPLADGWYAHQAAAVRIPERMIEEAYQRMYELV
jgi:hypothetical protein